MVFQVFPLEDVCPGTQHVSRRSFKELMLLTDLGDVYETTVEPLILQYLAMTQFDVLIPKYRIGASIYLPGFPRIALRPEDPGAWPYGAPPLRPMHVDLTADQKMTIDLIYSCGVNPHSILQLRWALVKGPWPWGSRPAWLDPQAVLALLYDIHDGLPNTPRYMPGVDMLEEAWGGFWLGERGQRFPLRLPVCLGCLRNPFEIREYFVGLINKPISFPFYFLFIAFSLS